jgi:hypothetical protein
MRHRLPRAGTHIGVAAAAAEAAEGEQRLLRSRVPVVGVRLGRLPPHPRHRHPLTRFAADQINTNRARQLDRAKSTGPRRRKATEEEHPYLEKGRM